MRRNSNTRAIKTPPAPTRRAKRPPESIAAIGLGDLVPRFQNEGYDRDSLQRRRDWLEGRTGARLSHISALSFDSEQLRGNVENPIGIAQVPVGLAGPLLIQGQFAQGLFYVPMATTEGALIRSYERGMVALTQAGGVQTAVLQDENRIAPAFAFEDISAAAEFASWLQGQTREIKSAAETTTSHGKVLRVCHFQLGRHVLLEFAFSTGDAQGMNMIAKAADAACRWIAENYGAARYQLFSGFCSEKRPSAHIMTRGKGKRVTAGALLPHRILKTRLHVSAEELFQVWQAGALGNLQAGALGYTAHAANGLAAIFIATGQDVATVAHAACGITNFEIHPEGLYASITVPGLSVATVGGGTGLPTQREALEIMQCFGSGKAGKFAEIVAATLLGGELSMAAALASGEFVGAHERYGRNRPS